MVVFLHLLVERILRIVMHFLLDIFLFGYNRVSYHYRNRLMENLPCIIVANHSSHYDAGVLLSAFPYSMMHRVHPVAARDYFFSSRFKAVFFRIFMNVLPIERSAKLKEAFTATEDALSRGHSIIIFPEGTRSKSGKVASFKVGVGYLAAKYNLPVIPAYIDGAHDAMGKGHSVPRARKISVVFGKPVFFEGDREDREQWSVFAGSLRGAILNTRRAWQRARENRARGIVSRQDS